MSRLKVLLLAAGKSTRIGAAAGGGPKPLLLVGGLTILERNLRWLASEGIQEVWINLHFKPDSIREAVGDGSRLGVRVRYVYEDELLGTAGAVRNIWERGDEEFLVVYGDNLYRMDLADFLSFHQDRCGIGSLALFDRRTHPHTGIAAGRVTLAPDGRILAFHEGADDSSSPIVNAGVYLLRSDAVERIPPGRFHDFGTDLFPALLADGKALYGYVISGYCLGVDTPESLQRAMELIRQGEVELA